MHCIFIIYFVHFFSLIIFYDLFAEMVASDSFARKERFDKRLFLLHLYDTLIRKTCTYKSVSYGNHLCYPSFSNFYGAQLN